MQSQRLPLKLLNLTSFFFWDSILDSQIGLPVLHVDILGLDDLRKIICKNVMIDGPSRRNNPIEHDFTRLYETNGSPLWHPWVRWIFKCDIYFDGWCFDKGTPWCRRTNQTPAPWNETAWKGEEPA